MQGVAGGLRAEFAIVLQASIPERLATLMRKLDGDPDQHPGEVCDYWIIPTETQSGADHRGRRELRRLTVALLEEGELETIECESAAAPTRMVSPAGLAPTSGEIVTQIQLGGPGRIRWFESYMGRSPPQFSSAPRLAAGQAWFFDLSQTEDRPER